MPASTSSSICTPASTESKAFIAYLTDNMENSPTERGAINTSHEQLFRVLPVLHQSNVVRSIVPTRIKGPHGPVFAITMARRDPQGTFGAFLGFAAAPCANGELALTGPLRRLPGTDAVITYAYVVRGPMGDEISDLRVEVATQPMSQLHHNTRTTQQSHLVGRARGNLRVIDAPGESFGVLVSIESLDADLPPQAPPGVRRHDLHLLGTGWYPLDSGLAFLLVHHVVLDKTDLCNLPAANRVNPSFFAPPALRLLANIDATGVHMPPTVAAYAIAFRNLPSPVIELKAGVPVVTGDSAAGLRDDPAYVMHSGPGNPSPWHFTNAPDWLHGLYSSAETATARLKASKLKGTVVGVEATGGAPTAGLPFVLPADRPPPPKGEVFMCSSY